MIRLKEIEKYYTNGVLKTYVLRNIDLKVDAGEFITIMGPSGAGKSTLLHILGLLDDPSSGEYFIDDQPVHKLSEKKRAELHKNFIGFVFQQYHLIEELTVYENLETPLLYKKIKSLERKSMVCDILDRFRIVAKKDLFPQQLSGGQQQQVAVARAIITGPQLILADEPTGSLHSTQGKEIMEMLKQLNEEAGTTIIQVTHSEECAAYSNRIIQLADGWIKKD